MPAVTEAQAAAARAALAQYEEQQAAIAFAAENARRALARAPIEPLTDIFTEDFRGRVDALKTFVPSIPPENENLIIFVNNALTCVKAAINEFDRLFLANAEIVPAAMPTTPVLPPVEPAPDPEE